MRRRDLIRAAAAAPVVALGAGAGSEGSAEPLAPQGYNPFPGMNVLFVITDQQRETQHFPKGWEAKNLPNLQRLRQHGLSFDRAFTNSAMCSPARSTLFTGYFPAQHGVKYTLEADMPAESYPQVELPTDLPNLATVMTAAGFATPFKGKWHCSKAASGETAPAQNPPCVPNEGWVPEDLAKYGFERWNPQDAGANQDICQAGGGSVNNDGRFLFDDGDPDAGQEGVISYLRSQAAQDQPFFLTCALVNPHDVLFYPSNFADSGYGPEWLASTGIEIPETADEDLSTKPWAQQQFLALSSGIAPGTRAEQQAYLHFYGNLMRLQDQYLGIVLDTLEEVGLTDNTVVVYTSDHGEMGITHGGMIQKNFNFYEETMRVPLVWSNPKLWPKPRQTNALVSHVDFLPTVASLFRAPQNARADWQGTDYSSVVLGETGKKGKKAKGVQDYVVFTFDDWQGGQVSGPYVTGPNHLVGIREERYKLARYYDPEGGYPDQWEMYDLKTDELERRNLTNPSVRATKAQWQAYKRLRVKLEAVEQTRLAPLA